MEGKKDSTIFKIPIGRLGLLSSLLVGGVCGFLVFFVTFFLAIIGVAIYDSATGTSMLNLNISYLYIAAPVGIFAMLVSMTYLLTPVVCENCLAQNDGIFLIDLPLWAW